MSAQITIDDLATWLGDQSWSSFAKSLASAHKRYGKLTERQEAAARSMHTKCSARTAAREAAKNIPAPKVGFYCTADGMFYRVQSNKAKTNVYAKELQTSGSGKPFWKYVGRLPFASLNNDVRLTAVQAAEFGHTHGACLICMKELTDPESVARGIGPVCATRLEY
tara:strand:+ start:1273 stop:1770 length:498 start_codon:yes stop_codon:yes gene_type:complete